MLLLWNIEGLNREPIGNIINVLDIVRHDYSKRFLKKIRREFTRPPSKLRCGVARGHIIPIGDGRDYVGFCINVASRLQKLNEFSFAIAQKGLSNFGRSKADYWFDSFVLIKAGVRDVGNEELVYVLKEEFDLLSEEDKNRMLP